MTDAQVYINWGRFVADCPKPGCTGALMVQPGETGMQCTYCGTLALLVWPADGPQLMAALADRAEKHRNWYPADFGRPLPVGTATGQTADDLQAETQAYLDRPAEPASDDRTTMNQMLARFGVELDADGTTLRRL